ncbi:MAG: hypothetical protein WC901_00560 [Candidatus Margulisiibacteriota bacterium]
MPVEFIGNQARARFVHSVWRADKMYTGYADMLTERGQAAARVMRIANAAVFTDNFDVPVIGEAEGILACMPKPRQVSLTEGGEDNWSKWFDLSQGSAGINFPRVGAIGDGCIRPCSFCMQENRFSWGSFDPFPVVVGKIIAATNSVIPFFVGGQRSGTVYFNGYHKNDILEWCDPLLGLHFDTLVRFAFDYACAQHRQLNLQNYTSGFDENDWRAEEAAKNISNFPEIFLEERITVSFHLGKEKPSLIRAVYQHPQHQIPQWIIDAYVRRYRKVFQALGQARGSIDAYVFLYGQSRYGPLGAAFYSATNQALRACNITGGRQSEIYLAGFGGDFITRLAMAQQGNPDCLMPTPIKAGILRPREYLRPYPVNKINADGLFRVYSPDQAKRVQTQLDLLWPKPDADYISLVNQIAA